MSICDHHPVYQKLSLSSSEASKKESNLIIQDELTWGLSYRNYKKKAKAIPIPPKKSPLEIPFTICREKMRKEKKLKNARKQPKKPKMKTPSLLERSIMSQEKYMDYLSIPNPKFEQPPPKKGKRRKCEIEPCPPRLVQLAVPNKRRVFANWKDYHNFLPTEMVMRFEQILHTDKNLEPREARFYYKILDKKKRKQIRETKKLKRKMKLEKQKGDQKWLKEQINFTINAILDYIKEEPLFSLNYKQMLLSDGILERLDRNKIFKQPSRNTKSAYKKTIIEVSDKMAVWMDTLTRFVDVQAVESEEDIPPLTISSLEDMEGESSEELYSSSEEGEEMEDGEEDEKTILEVDEYGEEEHLDSKLLDYQKKQILSDIFRPQAGEGMSDLDDFLEELDMDLLDKLIEILANCSDDFLESSVDEERMPGIKYTDILDKLRELKFKLLNQPQKPFLEQIMIDWAMRNDPDKVDEKILKQIHDVAALLGDSLYYKHRGTMLAVTDIDVEGSLVPKQSAEEHDSFVELTDEVIKSFLEVPDIPSMQEEIQQAGEEDESLGDVEPRGDDRSNVDTGTMLSFIDIEATKDELLTSSILGEGSEIGELEAEEAVKVVTPLGVSSELLPGEKEISVIYEPGIELTAEDAGKIIKGHKPSIVLEHSPSTVCCLSLKTWAVWLLEITHNAHGWTKWMHGIIVQVKEYVAIIRGDVTLPNGQNKVLHKEEWRRFAKETEESVIAWRQYSAHVKELSGSIIDNFHGKKVNCCPKCLQDHLIKNVVNAHETLEALTEAMNCASYWQRSLDELAEKATALANLESIEEEPTISVESDDSVAIADIEEVNECTCKRAADSEESIYEIEEIDVNTPTERSNMQRPSLRNQRTCGPNQSSQKKGCGPNDYGQRF